MLKIFAFDFCFSEVSQWSDCYCFECNLFFPLGIFFFFLQFLSLFFIFCSFTDFSNNDVPLFTLYGIGWPSGIRWFVSFILPGKLSNIFQILTLPCFLSLFYFQDSNQNIRYTFPLDLLFFVRVFNTFFSPCPTFWIFSSSPYSALLFFLQLWLLSY